MEAWMMGPSAQVSEKGTPSSMTSAPHASRSLSASAVVARSGSPAVIYGMNAVCHHTHGHTVNQSSFTIIRTRNSKPNYMY
jgi:hypothetical protein